jgi:hypothetical protein
MAVRSGVLSVQANESSGRFVLIAVPNSAGDRGVTLLPVVDLDFPVPFYLICRKDNQSALLQIFVAQVEVVVPALGERHNARHATAGS